MQRKRELERDLGVVFYMVTYVCRINFPGQEIMVLWVYLAIVTVPNPLVGNTDVFWRNQIFTFPQRAVKAS